MKGLKKADAVSLFKKLGNFITMYGATAYYTDNKNTIHEILAYCNKKALGQDLKLEVKITGDTQKERGVNLLEVLDQVGPNTSITLSDGRYSLPDGADLIIGVPKITLIGSENVEFITPVVIAGSDIAIKTAIFDKLMLKDGCQNITVDNSDINKLTVVGAEDTTFSRSLITSAVVTGGDDIVFDHCSLISEGDKYPALLLQQSGVELTDSLLYSKNVAISFIKTGVKRLEKPKLRKTLIFGEKGFISILDDGRRKFITKKIDTRPYISATSVEYDIPIFNDAENKDYTLSTVSPGARAASDKKDMGVNR